MLNFFKKKPETPSDILLEEIKNILFPPIETQKDKEGNIFHIDYSIDTNIESVLNDLQEGFNDETSQKTLKKISERIFDIRKLLDLKQQLNPDAKYIVVDDDNNNTEKQ